MKKKVRRKRYNTYKGNSSALDQVLNTVFIVGGTMMSGYTMEYSSGNALLPVRRKGLITLDSVIKIKANDLLTDELLMKSLTTVKRKWAALAISISKDSDGRIFYDHVGKNIKGRYLPSDEYITEQVHGLKSKVVEKANDKYLKSVFTIAFPQQDVEAEQFDNLAEQFLPNKLNLGAADDEHALMSLRLKLMDDPDYVTLLKEAGHWDNLGKLIKATILGF